MSVSDMSNCYSEVISILNKVCEEDYNKIPKDIIETIRMNANPSYTFKYNPSKTLDEQKDTDAKTAAMNSLNALRARAQETEKQQ